MNIPSVNTFMNSTRSEKSAKFQCLQKNEHLLVEGKINSKSETKLYLTVQNIYHCSFNNKIEIRNIFQISQKLKIEEEIHKTHLSEKIEKYEKGEEIMSIFKFNSTIFKLI
jgi:hypothetical protein